MNKTQQRFYFPNIWTHRSLPVCVRNAHSSEVREAAGIFFVFIRNDEERLLKFVIVEFLKRDGCCDGGENGDVCERERVKDIRVHLYFSTSRSHTQACSGRLTHIPSLTGKPGGSFIWTNSRSLLKCLNGAMTSNTFSNLETGQPLVSSFLQLLFYSVKTQQYVKDCL